MSYNQIDWADRSSTDSALHRSSVRSSVRASVDSCMRPSVDDAVSMQVVADALQLRIKKLAETNSRIRKQILRFEELNETQRKEVRLMIHEAMELAE